MMQVRFMMLPVSTNMSGPPSIFTSGSEIFSSPYDQFISAQTISSPANTKHKHIREEEHCREN